MKLERIVAVKGGRAQAQSGSFFNILGNVGFVPGQIAPALAGHVIGLTGNQSKRSPGEASGPARDDQLIPVYYRFADDFNSNYSLVETGFGIPVLSVVLQRYTSGFDQFALLLHCYSGDNEYFVWFSGAHCVITKNGSKIADFTSVFADTPTESDAYIDDDGDLIWGAAGQIGDIVTLAKYQNGTLISQRSYSENAIESAAESIMLQKLAGVSYSAVVTPGTPTTMAEVGYSDKPAQDGLVYQASYDGLGVADSGSYDADAFAGLPLVDFFNSDFLTPMYCSGSVFIQTHISAWSDLYGDESYYGHGFAAQLNNTTIKRISNGVIIAEKQEQQEPVSGVLENVVYAMTITISTGTFDEERQQYPITRTINQTLCTVEITASLPSINTDTQAAISTDVGNGYVVKNRLKIEDVFGWVSPVGWIDRDGAKIYDAPQYNKLSGAWRSGRPNTAEALGVACGKVLKIRQDSVTESTPPIDFSTVVTKRFT